MRRTEIAVVVSDIHCGSEVGLAPPKVKLRNGNIVSFGDNIHQKWLWANWQTMTAGVKKIIGKERAILIVNGDATEGVHHRNEKDLIASEIDKHVDMAVECLKPLSAMVEKTYVIKGTECHTLNLENLLAKELGAVGKAAKDKWLIDVNGCLVDAAHHMGVTSRTYLEASAMSIHMGNAILNSIRMDHRPAKVYLRGHRHCGGWYTDGSGLFCVTGGWQFLTRHGYKVVTDSIPSPTVIVLDWRGKPNGALPQVHELKFKPPQDEIEKV